MWFSEVLYTKYHSFSGRRNITTAKAGTVAFTGDASSRRLYEVVTTTRIMSASDEDMYVPYGERPEWADVAPVLQPESVNPGEGESTPSSFYV